MVDKVYSRFVKEKNINPNYTKEWISLVDEAIRRFNLNAEIIEDENKGLIIKLDDLSKNILEKITFCVENIETTLNYLFEGNVYII